MPSTTRIKSAITNATRRKGRKIIPTKNQGLSDEPLLDKSKPGYGFTMVILVSLRAEI